MYILAAMLVLLLIFKYTPPSFKFDLHIHHHHTLKTESGTEVLPEDLERALNSQTPSMDQLVSTLNEAMDALMNEEEVPE